MKKAQILSALVVAGALGVMMPGAVWAKDDAAKPSIVALIRATNDVEIAAAEARLLGVTTYDEYLQGLVEQSVKAQGEYEKRSAEDICELVAALEDGAFVTKLLTRQGQEKTAAAEGAAIEEPKVAMAVETVKTENAKKVEGVGKVVAKKAVAEVAQAEKNISKVAVPNTSAGKVMASAASAQSNYLVMVGLAMVTFVVGLVAGIGRKVKLAKAEK